MLVLCCFFFSELECGVNSTLFNKLFTVELFRFGVVFLLASGDVCFAIPFCFMISAEGESGGEEGEVATIAVE